MVQSFGKQTEIIYFNLPIANIFALTEYSVNEYKRRAVHSIWHQLISIDLKLRNSRDFLFTTRHTPKMRDIIIIPVVALAATFFFIGTVAQDDTGSAADDGICGRNCPNPGVCDLKTICNLNEVPCLLPTESCSGPCTTCQCCPQCKNCTIQDAECREKCASVRKIPCPIVRDDTADCGPCNCCCDEKAENENCIRGCQEVTGTDPIGPVYLDPFTHECSKCECKNCTTLNGECCKKCAANGEVQCDPLQQDPFSGLCDSNTCKCCPRPLCQFTDECRKRNEVPCFKGREDCPCCVGCGCCSSCNCKETCDLECKKKLDNAKAFACEPEINPNPYTGLCDCGMCCPFR